MTKILVFDYIEKRVTVVGSGVEQQKKLSQVLAAQKELVTTGGAAPGKA